MYYQRRPIPDCDIFPYTKKEQFILKRLATKRKLFAFLRNHRHEIFDEEFQEELESMYGTPGRGRSQRRRR
jgi:hypothetical protein